MKRRLAVINYHYSIRKTKRSAYMLGMILPMVLLFPLAVMANDKVDLQNGSKDARTLSQQQKVTVTGTITDEDGAALPGVNITEKGTTNGSISDLKGKYTLSASGPEAVLVFSFMGYLTKEIPVGNSTQIDIQMKLDMKNLDEVVVVGYGTMKKSDVTGAMISLSSDDISTSPANNGLEALQGKAAGLDITSNERPGETGKIYLRGFRSINASNTPLYVVDGLPLITEGIQHLNPTDIESIDILKDASATAIYGSRGANGVIIITTKSGKSGRLSVNYDASLKIENMKDLTTMMNAQQYIEFRREAYRNAGDYPDAPTYEDDYDIFGGDEYAWANVAKGWESGTWDGSKVSTTDWTGYVQKTGITHNHTLRVSGGTEKIKTSTSFGYLKQEGTQLGQDYTRYSASSKINLVPIQYFKFGSSITGSYGDQNYGYKSTSSSGANSLYFSARSMLPYAVPYDGEGNRINLPGGDVNILNPIGEDKYSINERWMLRVLGNFYAELNFLKYFKYRVNFGIDFYNRENGIYRDAMSINQGGGESGSVNFASYKTEFKRSWTLDNIIYFDKKFGKHTLNATLLQTATDYKYKYSFQAAEDLPWDDQLWYQLNSVSELKSWYTGISENQLASYMARLNYNWSEKYLLTTSIRWDGASQLADGHKWDYFPSLALGWRISQENFMENVPWVNQLKLRMGYGTTGNSAIDAYATKGDITQNYYTWGSEVDDGYISSDASLKEPNAMANEELGWERTTQVNLGIDFSVIDNRISGVLDVYVSKTTDLLMEMSLPSVLGYTTSWANIGSTKNKGIDITLNTINIRQSNFTWSSSLSFSASKDDITELSNGKEDDVDNEWFIGERLSVRYNYEKIGIWQNTEEDLAEMDKFNENGHEFEPGDIRVKDLNGDYKIDASSDKKILGHTYPSWTGGLTNTFEYKRWDLSFFIYSRWNFLIKAGAESLQGRYSQRLVDYWTKDNPTNNYPAPNYDDASGDPYKNSMNYQDGSFIKLRNLSLGYTLPILKNNNLHIQRIRFYAQIKNAGLLYTKCDWLDPDLGISTFNRSWIFGLNFEF